MEELTGTGYPFLRGEAVLERHIAVEGNERFLESLSPKLGPKLSRAGDTVVTTKGNSTGRAAYVRPDLPTFVYSPHLSFWRSLDHDKLHPGFLREWAHGPEFLGQLNGMKDSTDMAPYLSLTDQRRLEITLPLPDAQQAIAGVLGALDDKIELNRRMNRTLEELAAALFRSWFVDFDPVVAKAAGRKPAHLRPALAALFPAHWQDSPLGPIPHGWDAKPIGDVVKVVGGTTPSTNEPKFWNGDIAWATPRDLAALSDPVLIATARQITPAGLNEISSGLLPKGSVLLSSRAPIGYTVISDIPVAVNQGFIALLCDGPLPNYYVLEWVRENMETIEGRANGTTFMEISKTNFRPIQVVVPPPTVLEKFMEIASPWWRQVIHNVRESRTLAALRDTLLPRLLSGELRVKSAEKLVEATA